LLPLLLLMLVGWLNLDMKCISKIAPVPHIKQCFIA
jgi:hypothetical protein